jgi:hypothetical protein
VRAHSRQLSVYLVVFCLTLSACGGGGEDDDADPQPTTTSPSTTQSQEEEDEQALRQLAEDWYEHSDRIYQHRAEPESASDYLLDPYLADYVARATDVVDAGQISEPGAESTAEVLDVSIEGDTATVVECAVDADVLRASDGAVVNDEVVTLKLETDAIRTPEGWRFTERRTLEEMPGSGECDA